MGSNPIGALEMSNFLIAIILETRLSENFLVVLSNGLTTRAHAGGLLKNYRKYLGNLFCILGYLDFYRIFVAPSETEALILL